MALVLLSGATMTYGQVKIKDGNVSNDKETLPGTDAILELSSAKKGLLFLSLSLSYANSAALLCAHTEVGVFTIPHPFAM